MALKQCDRCARRTLKSHRDADAADAVLRFENAEVQVRAAGETSVARTSNHVSRLDHLPGLNPDTMLRQMAVLPQCSVIVPNDDEIIERVVAHTAAAGC